VLLRRADQADTTEHTMMKTSQESRALLAALGAALAVSAAGCGDRPPDPTVSQQRPGSESGASTVERATASAERQFEKAGKALDDATVTAKVKTALVAEPDLKALSINVDTTAGIVTLRGTTNSANAKTHAEQIASTIEGVRSVKNELVVIRG
jgi:osmotically-inducible protein OsmY